MCVRMSLSPGQRRGLQIQVVYFLLHTHVYMCILIITALILY